MLTIFILLGSSISRNVVKKRFIWSIISWERENKIWNINLFGILFSLCKWKFIFVPDDIRVNRSAVQETFRKSVPWKVVSIHRMGMRCVREIFISSRKWCNVLGNPIKILQIDNHINNTILVRLNYRLYCLC